MDVLWEDGRPVELAKMLEELGSVKAESMLISMEAWLEFCPGFEAEEWLSRSTELNLGGREKQLCHHVCDDD